MKLSYEALLLIPPKFETFVDSLQICSLQSSRPYLGDKGYLVRIPASLHELSIDSSKLKTRSR
ncbi:hypothetical protein F2Q68_00030760 [Brassica cretica]|uniref:Uncharacterized protein n=1 Tax=Brassica cretica TaxID=69181 RepID=A0A8S9G9Z9_BRACR|nr:hypothetical protein F2Q68_00030760 [Brassica cretica]